MVKMLKAAGGWEVSIAAFGLGVRQCFAWSQRKSYVTLRDGGDVLLLRDSDGDDKFEDLITVAADFKGVHRITRKDNYMHLCNNNELRRDDGTFGAHETLIDDLPDGGQHPNGTVEWR